MQICFKLVQVASSGSESMRISGQFAFLVVALASSALTHSVSGSSTQNNTAETAASKMNLTTKNVTQKLDNHGANVSESQLTISNPFKEKNSIQKMNLSNGLKSQDEHLTNKDKTHTSSSSPQASDSSCANDGNGGCNDNQKTSKKNSDDSKNKDGTDNKEQKHNTKPDVNSIKDKIKSDMKNRFKLPIDIPIP